MGSCLRTTQELLQESQIGTEAATRRSDSCGESGSQPRRKLRPARAAQHLERRPIPGRTVGLWQPQASIRMRACQYRSTIAQILANVLRQQDQVHQRTWKVLGRQSPPRAREVSPERNRVVGTCVRVTIVRALPRVAPCSRDSLLGGPETHPASGRLAHRGDRGGCRRRVHRSGSFARFLLSSIASLRGVGKQHSKFRSSPSEARHDCPCHAPQNNSDFLVGQLLVLAQQDDLTKLHGGCWIASCTCSRSTLLIYSA